MKYQRWYDQIIERATRRRHAGLYVERHHVVPRALGGSDDPINLVDLTYREHFLVHWLLTRIYAGRDKYVMVFALHCMSMTLGGRIVASWQFEVAKRVMRREYLIRAKFRIEERREKRKAALKAKADAAAAVPKKVQGLNLTTSADKNYVSLLAADWLNATAVRKGGRNKRVQAANIRAKMIVTEANKILGLPKPGEDWEDPVHKRKRYPSKREREEIKRRRSLERRIART
jgi:hypothetical protein